MIVYFKTRKMIGHAREQGKLLYLEAPSQSSITKGQTTLFICFKTSIFQRVWLHHRRIGHPSYSVVKSMFSSLSQGLDVENFHCDVCELAKHNHVPFLTSTVIPMFCSTLTNQFGINIKRFRSDSSGNYFNQILT